MADVFTRGVRGIRLRYAVIGVAFLALTVTLFHLGGPMSFGWYSFIAVLVLTLMVLTLFLMQCHFVLAPIERLTVALNGLLERPIDGSESLRIQWNGKDEFANLAAAVNDALEAVQNRSIGVLEENRRLRDVVSISDSELVVMNGAGSVLNVIHCPEEMNPVPGLAHGSRPDAAIWGEKNSAAFMKGLAAVCGQGGRQSVDLAFGTGDDGRKARRIRAFIVRPKDRKFPIVVFRDADHPSGAVRSSGPQMPMTRIATGVARDLRNVFTVIRNVAAKYEGTDKPELREELATIRKAIQSGFAMIEELETLGGESHLRLKHRTAAEVIGDARVLIGGLVSNGGIGLSYDLGDGLPDVLVDQDQIDKVFVNLVRNAIEAFGAVPGRIVVSARSFAMSADEGEDFTPPVAPGEGVLITVFDNGPGMQEQTRAHAFEPYCTTKATGRGLGLSIASSIVAAHGGGMRISSVRGVSTAVEIFLRKAERPSEDLDLLRKEFPGGEILAIDDNTAVLRITAALLRTQKIMTHVADCHKDAIRKFSELSTRLRAVFLDAQLGDSNSTGLLADMRAANPDVPVVVVSGYTAAQINSIFAACPPDAFLMKPYTVEELQQVLSALPARAC